MRNIEPSAEYPDIRVSRENGQPEEPVFPQVCPACEAPPKRFKWTPGLLNARMLYQCGGAYLNVDQIQNHSHVWRGRCGVPS